MEALYSASAFKLAIRIKSIGIAIIGLNGMTMAIVYTATATDVRVTIALAGINAIGQPTTNTTSPTSITEAMAGIITRCDK